MWMPQFSADPMDPRVGGLVSVRTMRLGILSIVSLMLFVAAVSYLPKKGGPEPAVSAEDITAYFEAEGFTVYDVQYDKVPRGIVPYGGYLWNESQGEWYVGKEEQKPDADRSYTYTGAVWVGFYDLPESAAEAVSGLSADGSRLVTAGLGGDRTIGIGRDSNRRIYLYENTVVYYEGGDDAVYTALEKLCGEPVADGRNTEG